MYSALQGTRKWAVRFRVARIESVNRAVNSHDVSVSRAQLGTGFVKYLIDRERELRRKEQDPHDYAHCGS